MARAYARGQSFDVGSQASLRESDAQPSAVEYVLGALGGDLLCGLERAAEGQGIPLHAIEIALNGRLDNVLTHLGVVGEQGHPGFARNRGHGLRQRRRRSKTIESRLAANPRPLAALPHPVALR